MTAEGGCLSSYLRLIIILSVTIEYMGGKLQYLEIKNFMRWVATLKRSEPMIFTDIEELRRTVPAEYDFFT